MEGQWTAEISGEATGTLIIDIDDCYDHFEGSVRLFLDGEAGVACEIRTPNQDARQKLEQVPLYWMPPDRAVIQSRDEIQHENPEIAFPATANVTLALQDGILHVEWETDQGRTGKARLERSKAEHPSDIEPNYEVGTWDEFKKFAIDQEPGRLIFRGQPEAFRLRTAFHRTSRKDLVKYMIRDVPLAHKLLTAKTRHLFDLARPEQVGAFYNLLQHHGYPTPLLDWTYSPFVAAFFAYRRRPRHDAPSDKIRIFVFNKDAWEREFNQLQVLNFSKPHFSILEALAIENQRAIPQQALSTLTNVDDIEGYIRYREHGCGKGFLSAIDLPASLRRQVMVELSFMGITAGSLFPGLDGTCEELRGRMFHQQVPR